MKGSDRAQNLAKVYERMLEEVGMEDDRNLIYFFMGCIYAATCIYDTVLMDEIEEEIKNER